LDSKGLVAVWREGLLAKAVLNGKTKGYKNHPQLIRFKNQKEPLIFIDSYLNNVFKEARNRGYNFDHEKIGSQTTKKHITVTQGQMKYEFKHLKEKLKTRDWDKYQELTQINLPIPNPIFRVIPGDVESWEKIKTGK
jgi:hypothetical protein